MIRDLQMLDGRREEATLAELGIAMIWYEEHDDIAFAKRRPHRTFPAMPSAQGVMARGICFRSHGRARSLLLGGTDAEVYCLLVANGSREPGDISAARLRH
jgi:hypothetical protein